MFLKKLKTKRDKVRNEVSTYIGSEKYVMEPIKMVSIHPIINNDRKDTGMMFQRKMKRRREEIK